MNAVNRHIEAFLPRYRAALRRATSADGQGDVDAAFDLGRAAIDDGLGLIELASVHADCLSALLDNVPSATAAVVAESAHRFFLHALAPFEMVHRAFRDTNEQIESLNRELQRNVDDLRELAAVVLAADDAIMTLDRAGVIRSWNPAAERLYGYRETEIIGKSVTSLIPPEHNDATLNRRVIELGESVSQLETVRLHKDGQLLYVSLTISPIRNQAGQTAAIVSIARDISERKHAEAAHASLEAQLRQSQKMEAIGRLAGGIAHDFNNLLTVILGHSRLLASQVSDTAIVNDLTAIDTAATRAAELTRQLLSFSRQQVLQPQRTNCNEIITGTLDMLQRVIGEDIILDYSLDTELDDVIVDRGQLTQVVLNIAVNARDAMPAGGNLQLKTANVYLDDHYADEHIDVTPGQHILIQITDSGIGIDADTQARVFDPFFTTKSDGTGLGLATVYGIIKQSGGHIWLYSEPGRGTTFKIYIPTAPADAPTVAPTASATPDTLTGTETILVVEDADGVRDLVTQITRRYGYNVLEAASPEQAIDLANSTEHIDLLLTDVVMPGMNGRELADTLRAQRPELKVLFTSGYPADTIVRQGIADTTEAYIEKPYIPEHLARKIRDTLATRPQGR